MPYKKGLVVKTGADGWAEVITDKLDACAACATARNCPSSCKSTRMVTRVLNRAGAREGDMVSIYQSTGSVLQSAALLYLIPVACLIIGALIGAGISDKLAIDESSSALLFGLTGLGVGFVSLAQFSKRISTKSRFMPTIVDVIISVPAGTPIS
jgi:sigma-E factor negative regulatory protein RseC